MREYDASRTKKIKQTDQLTKHRIILIWNQIGTMKTHGVPHMALKF